MSVLPASVLLFLKLIRWPLFKDDMFGDVIFEHIANWSTFSHEAKDFVFFFTLYMHFCYFCIFSSICIFQLGAIVTLII